AGRIQVRPAAQIQIESGRISLLLDAELVELANHPPIVEAVLPGDLRVTEVTGSGLTDWTIAQGDRLRLFWDRPGALSRRRVRVSGWIPLNDDPMRVRPRRYRMRTPWIDWPAAEMLPGTLAVSSSSRVELFGAAGVSPMKDSAGSNTPVAPRFRQNY